MVLKKDKAKVLDEVWTQQRVKDFLEIKPVEDVERDFHVLLKAYQSMRLENFEDFVGFFIADNRDINAPGSAGETVLSILLEHRNSSEYRAILEANGAR